MNQSTRRLLYGAIALGVVAGSTVWLPVPTQAPTGWSIAGPMATDNPSCAGGLSCFGTAPDSSSAYFLEVIQGGDVAATATGNAYFGSHWSNVVGTGFKQAGATLNMWDSATRTTLYASVSFTFGR